MATTTITLNGDNALFTGTVNESGGTTNVYASADEPYQGGSDTDYIQLNFATVPDQVYSNWFDLSTTPSDFGPPSAISCRFRRRVANRVDDNHFMRFRIFDSTKTTAYTTEGSSNPFETTFTDATAFAFSLTAAGVAASKADWDSAVLAISHYRSNVMSADSTGEIQISQIDFEITYTAAGPSFSKTDPVGLTDSISVVKSTQRTVTDSIGIDDSGVVEMPLNHERVGLTDSISVALARAVTIGYAYLVDENGNQILDENGDPILAGSDAEMVGITDSVTAVRSAAVSISDTVGITDAATVAASWSRSTADPVGLTDSAARATSTQRSASDPVGLTDSIAVVVSRSVALSDNVGITDSITVLRSVEVSLSDNVGLTDAVSRVSQATSSLSDSVGITDAATTTAVTSRSAADAVGLTDSIAVVVSRSVALSDNVGLTDSNSPVGSAVRDQSDPVGLTDAVATATGHARSPADNVGITDAISVSIGRGVSISDTIGITDAGTWDYDRLGDNIGITDSVTVETSGAVAHERSISDPVGITDSAIFERSLVVTVTDSVGVDDPQAHLDVGGPIVGTPTSGTLFPTTSATLTIDVLGRFLAKRTVLATTLDGTGGYEFRIGANGLMSFEAQSRGTATSSSGATPTFDSPAMWNATAFRVQVPFVTDWPQEPSFDPITFYYSTQPLGDAPVWISAGTDSLLAGPMFAAAVERLVVGARYDGTEGGGQVRSVTITFGATTLADGDFGYPPEDFIQGTTSWDLSDASFAPEVDAVLTAVRSLDDAVGLTDTVSTARTIAISITDAIGLTDAASPAQAASRSVDDAIGLTDSASSTAGLQRSQTDPVGITDAAASSLEVVRALSDNVGVADGATLALPTMRVNGDGNGTLHQPRQWAAQEYTRIDENIATPDGVSIVGPFAASGKTSFTLVDVPSDFSSMQALSVTIRCAIQNRVDDNLALLVKIVDSADGTLLAGGGAAESQLAVGFNDSSVMTTKAPVAFTTINSTASKAQWDRAILQINATYVATGGADTFVSYLVDAVEFTGSYQAAGVSVVLGAERSQVDAVGLTDTISPARALIRSVTDAVGLTDEVSVALDVARSVSDPVGLTDATETSLDVARSVTDPVGLTDEVLITLSRGVSDDVAVTDTVSRSTSMERALSDGVGISDLSSTGEVEVRQLTDDVGASDDTTRIVAFGRSLTDTLGVTDETSSTLSALRAVTDAAGITDTISVALSVDRPLVDQVGLTDTVDVDLTSGAVDHTVSVSDNVGVTDSDAREANFVTVLTDSVGLTDTATTGRSIQVVLTDSVGVADTASATRELVATITDDIGVTDSTARASTIERSASDAIAALDDLTIEAEFYRIVEDTVVTTDLAENTSSTSISVLLADLVGITDPDPVAERYLATLIRLHLEHEIQERSMVAALQERTLAITAVAERPFDDQVHDALLIKEEPE